jgi:hypothetical protein
LSPVHRWRKAIYTSNYSATASPHNSQQTTAPAKPFPACCVLTSRSLATASNSGDSSASRAHGIPGWSSSHNSTKLQICPIDKPSARTTQKIQLFYCCMRVYRAVAQQGSRRRPQKTQVFYCCVHVYCGRYLGTAAIYTVTA